MPKPPKAITAPAESKLDLAKIEDADQAAQQMRTLQANYDQGRDLVNQMLGQIQMSRAISKFADVVSLSKLKQIKENKLYRAVAGQKGVSPSGEEIADVGTFEGFCSALGLSRSKVDEDLSNLDAFGEDALNQLNAIGLGYRDLRQFRKLPADQKTALIEAAKAGDKDTLLELAEDLIAKHIKEKDEFTQQAAEATQNYSALEQVNLKLVKEKHQLQLKVEKRALEPITPDAQAASLVATAYEASGTACAWVRGHLRRAIEELLEHDGQHGSDNRAVASGFITQIEDATDSLRLAFALPRLKSLDDDPFAPLSQDELDKLDAIMPQADVVSGG